MQSDHVVVVLCRAEGSTLDTPSIDVTCRIDVDKREHFELLRKSRSLKTDLHRFLYRRTIGAENLVPQWPVGIVASMHLALMMQNVFLGPLNEIAHPVRSPHVPVRKQRDKELEDTDNGDPTRIEPEQKGVTKILSVVETITSNGCATKALGISTRGTP
jgi:hypothetical protein